MAKRGSRTTAAVGVADHSGWAVLVTVAPDGTLLDRRRVELIEEGLPSMPHHHDAQKLPLKEAVALVERVRVSAETCSARRLETLARDVSAAVTHIALRVCPTWMPPTIAERIQDYRSQNNADWVMYRQALAGAAEALGWAVHWYDAKGVFADAARALGRNDVDALLASTGKKLGPPWQRDHRVAMAAAIAAGATKRR